MEEGLIKEIESLFGRNRITNQEARQILKRRNHWCDLMRKLSWKVRLLEKLLNYPILKHFGKSVYDLYEEIYPDINVSLAMCIVISVPISRKIDYDGIAKKILTIKKIENE